ncbi:hypothetical protein [Vibrio phage XZ1]|uniref:Uncharacterized protein n=1 Tax=Vibrio phage ValKK3 TaxID=1610855 RepID=A0A0D4DAT5_9CAUD|nr:hypothetical protein AVU32_gp120 [Vibrio phage ValKK3]AJT60961.1 hypothetical protein [Vibrio phage ValKK3]UOL51388.1 hypothetical protein [Vibrio phage XZ1]
MTRQTDFFGREIKDGDFVLRAKNSGRSYSMNVLLVVDLPDGRRKYLELRTYGGVSNNAKLPCGSSATIVEPEIVEQKYPDAYRAALVEAANLRTTIPR